MRRLLALLILAPGLVVSQGLRLVPFSVEASAAARSLELCQAAVPDVTATGPSDCDLLRRLFASRPGQARNWFPTWMAQHDSAMVSLVTQTRREGYDSRSSALLGLFPFAVREAAEFGTSAMRLEPMLPTLVAAARARNGDPVLLHACATVALEVREYPVARWCLHRALDVGVDSSALLLRLAWLDYQHGSDASGEAWLGKSLSVAEGPAEQAAVATLVEYLAVNHNRARASSERWGNETWTGILAATGADRMGRLLDLIADDPVVARDLIRRNMRELGYFSGALASCPDQISGAGTTDRACNYATHDRDGEPVPPTERRLDARAHQLWDPGSGLRVTVIGYHAERLRKMARERRTQHVELVTREWHAATPTRLLEQADTLALARLSAGHGVSTVPTPDGLGAWSLWMRGNAPLLFRASHDASTAIPTPDRVSDLLLGTPGHDPIWLMGTDSIVVPTTHDLDRKRPVELFYQLNTDATDSVTVNLRVMSDESSAEGITLALPVVVEAGITPVRHALDLGRLDRGDYLVTITISAAGSMNGTARSTRFRLR